MPVYPTAEALISVVVVVGKAVGNGLGPEVGSGVGVGVGFGSPGARRRTWSKLSAETWEMLAVARAPKARREPVIVRRFVT